MTLLNGNAPVLSVEDNFSLAYNGVYGKVVYDKATNTNNIEKVRGPLPYGKYVWDGVDHLGGMEKGEQRYVPFDVIRVYFGDPRSIMTGPQRFEDRRGNVGDIAPRPEETRRLSVLYGVYDTDAARVHEVVPDVLIMNAEDVPIFCPATDPSGLHVYGHLSESNESHDLATQLEQMKMQTRLLEERIKAQEQKGHDNTGSDVEVDGPKRGTAG